MKKLKEECERAWLEVEEAKAHESRAKKLTLAVKVELNKLKLMFGSKVQETAQLKSELAKARAKLNAIDSSKSAMFSSSASSTKLPSL